MRLTIPITAALLCNANPSIAQSDGDLAVHRQLIALQHKIAAAIVDRDSVFLDDIYAPEYVFIDGWGATHDRATVFRQMENRSIRTRNLNYRDIVVRRYGKTAVVTGLATVAIDYPKGSYRGDARFVRVHVRRNGRWLSTLYQITRIEER